MISKTPDQVDIADSSCTIFWYPVLKHPGYITRKIVMLLQLMLIYTWINLRFCQISI